MKLIFFAICLFAHTIQGTTVDLSWTYQDDTLYWHDNENFEINITKLGAEDPDYYQIDKICTATHGGTHLDSPLHFNSKGWSVAEIPLDHLFDVPVAVIDVVTKCANERKYHVTIEDITEWELKNGVIPDGALLLIKTGHSKFWKQRDLYFGPSDDKAFPALDVTTARWLAKNRSIHGLGLDSPSIDVFPSLEGHKVLAAKNVYNLESVSDEIHKVPATGARGFVFPMKIAKASGAPVRIVVKF